MPNSNVYDDTLSSASASVGSNTRERDVRKKAIVQYAMDCPVSSRARKGPALMSSRPEWVVKKYATANTDGALEGAPFAAADAENNLANKAILSSRYQIARRRIMVTKQARAMVNQFAVEGDLYEDNKRDKGVEIQVDIEATLLSDNESVAPTDDSVAGKTRSIPRFVSNDNSRFTDADTTPAAAYRTPAASIVVSKNANGQDTTEEDLRGILTSIASARKKNFGEAMLICSPNGRNTLARFTYLDKNPTSTYQAVRRWNQKEETIDARATYYKSDHGDLEALTSYQLDSSVIMLILDMDSVEIAYAPGLGIAFEDMPPDGGNKRGQWEATWCAKLLNPVSAGKVITGATA